MLVVKILGDNDSLAYKETKRIVSSMDFTIMQSGCIDYDIAISIINAQISKSELKKATIGTLIFHPSPLPYGRGASSIRWAYKRKEPITAATWFWADEGLDTGDICEQEIIKINYSLRPSMFYERAIIPAMIRTLKRCLENIKFGIIRRIPQIPRYATFDYHL